MTANQDKTGGGVTCWVSELARAHARPLATIAQREGLTKEDAVDAVQEAFHAFLLLPQARGLERASSDARALLTTLVRNIARNERRRHHRARPHEETGAVADLADDDPSIDELLVRAEEHVQLRGCVAALAEVQRKVVTLRMLEELSGEEVARALELAPGNVAVLLHRAKKDLRACMEG